MDLKSGCPFWQVRDGLLGTYPPLTTDIRCDVVVIGGGVTGALVAHALVEAGMGTVLVDKRDFGSGSTSATTALLQYELDVPLLELSDRVGTEAAVACYRLAAGAIDELERIVAPLPDRCGFARRASVYLASRARDAKLFEREHAARTAAGFAVDLWSPAQVASVFPFRRPAALYTRLAAEVDPYRLTHSLIAAAARRGLRAFDRTEVLRLDAPASGSSARTRLATDRGTCIETGTVVFATGYETQTLLRQPAVRLRSTYAFASEPLAGGPGWPDGALIWESARPYLYLRTTADGRVIVGGEDDDFADAGRRDRSLPRKTARLVRRFKALFPDTPLEPAFAWAGTFAETPDGLPYIGRHPDYPNAWFAACYGGNGLVFGVVAASIIRDACLSRPNQATTLFRFDR